MADNIIRVDDVKHSKLGASSAHRWMNCPGSVALSDKLFSEGLARTAGPAAAEGTAAHTIGAACLLEGAEPWEYIGLEVEVDDWLFQVDPEMADAVDVWTDFVYGIMKQYEDKKPKLLVEHSMQSKLNKLAFGTSDTIILVPNTTLIVIDYKHGKGIVVEPDSTQNKYYGALAVENFAAEDLDGIETIEMYIVQPRIPHPKGLVRKYEDTVENITEWFKDDIITAMNMVEDGSELLVSGSWCRFCPARDHCPALKADVVDFDASLEPDYMDGVELGELLAKKPTIMAYFEKLEKEAFNRVVSGQDVEGYKLVKKISSRIWRDGVEDELIDKFGEDAYQERKLKTPPMVEKQLDGGREFVRKMATKPETGLTIAPVTDKREAVKRPMDLYLDSLEA